ncbi:hypothetical protein BSL78_03247 [Apostichopus japonicus]|uniref:Uncharacterized protein n=1 Tax=Stichopus japonicus TaxID=307972 RepID=A0A2G8LHV1_STIJA|nr:hypothetical protein BSL78_03247 [Apostichopus japonicus]
MARRRNRTPSERVGSCSSNTSRAFRAGAQTATIVINGDARVTRRSRHSVRMATPTSKRHPPLFKRKTPQDLSREGSLGRNEPPPPARRPSQIGCGTDRADLPRKHSFRFWDKLAIYLKSSGGRVALGGERDEPRRRAEGGPRQCHDRGRPPVGSKQADVGEEREWLHAGVFQSS